MDDKNDKRHAKPVKLNLGSGASCLDDWINIDNSLNARLTKRPWLRQFLFRIGVLPKRYYEIPWSAHINSIIVRDARKRLPFTDNSIDFIYSSHFIEHLSKAEAIKLMQQCFSVLKRGGVIRLSTPDLETMVRDYIRGVENFQNSDYLPSEKLLKSLGSLERGDKVPLSLKVFGVGGEHKWMYDRISLAELLKDSGFVDIKRRRYREGEVPDIDRLDNRPEHSLYVEAKKP